MTKHLTREQNLADTLQALRAVEEAVDALANYPRSLHNTDVFTIEHGLNDLRDSLVESWNGDEDEAIKIHLCNHSNYGALDSKCERWTTNVERGLYECDACQDEAENFAKERI